MAPPSPVTLPDVLAGDVQAPALVCARGGPSLSRGQLQSLCVTLANTLRNAGLGPGDVVTIADVNTVLLILPAAPAVFNSASYSYEGIHDRSGSEQKVSCNTVIKCCSPYFLLGQIWLAKLVRC